MKRQLLDILRCPLCFGELELTSIEEDSTEVRKGTLNCQRNQQHQFQVKEGIVCYETGFDDKIVQEEIVYQDSTYEGDPRLFDPAVVAKYPDSLPDIWPLTKNFGPDFRDLIDRLHFSPDSLTLDIGTAACWSTRLLAEQGGRVVALDICEADYHGLKASDIQFKFHGVFFERVLTSMTSLPFRDACFDHITFNASFHHTPSLEQTLKECYRVLKPHGTAAMVNEPFFSICQKIRAKDSDEDHEGSHHSVSYAEFSKTAREAGFSIQYLLSGHVREKLQKKLRFGMGNVAIKIFETIPFLLKQLNTSLILLSKTSR